MTSDGRTLKQLSDEATPQPWRVEATGDNFAVIQGGDGTGPGFDICWQEIPANQGGEANARLIVELVNAYREGRLVEAPERELCTACALPCDRYGCDCVDLAACNAAKLISQSSSVSSLPTREDETE